MKHTMYVDASYDRRTLKAGLGVYMCNEPEETNEHRLTVLAKDSVEAEILAIIMGVKKAIELGYKSIEICSDCSPAIGTLLGNQSKVLSKYLPLVGIYTGLVDDMGLIEFKQVASSTNLAHFVAKDAITNTPLTDFSEFLRSENR